MVMVVVSGYVVATSPPREAHRGPAGCRAAFAAPSVVAAVRMLTSLLNWGMSRFGGLLVRALARRTDLDMDYRAAGAAHLASGDLALGLGSSAAQSAARQAPGRCCRSPASSRSADDIPGNHGDHAVLIVVSMRWR
jgi:short-chain fatty acids transporter